MLRETWKIYILSCHRSTKPVENILNADSPPHSEDINKALSHIYVQFDEGSRFFKSSKPLGRHMQEFPWWLKK